MGVISLALVSRGSLAAKPFTVSDRLAENSAPAYGDVLCAVDLADK